MEPQRKTINKDDLLVQGCSKPSLGARKYPNVQRQDVDAASRVELKAGQRLQEVLAAIDLKYPGEQAEANIRSLSNSFQSIAYHKQVLLLFIKAWQKEMSLIKASNKRCTVVQYHYTFLPTKWWQTAKTSKLTVYVCWNQPVKVSTTNYEDFESVLTSSSRITQFVSKQAATGEKLPGSIDKKQLFTFRPFPAN